ncbi:uncharacterized protein [Pseudorasbora parva]|uniref:uncharacterized protein n=1 Tax=Pseudorasbora parva TaxID=51549 RepID=UPI00351F5192
MDGHYKDTTSIASQQSTLAANVELRAFQAIDHTANAELLAFQAIDLLSATPNDDDADELALFVTQPGFIDLTQEDNEAEVSTSVKSPTLGTPLIDLTLYDDNPGDSTSNESAPLRDGRGKSTTSRTGSPIISSTEVVDLTTESIGEHGSNNSASSYTNRQLRDTTTSHVPKAELIGDEVPVPCYTKQTLKRRRSSGVSTAARSSNNILIDDEVPGPSYTNHTGKRRRSTASSSTVWTPNDVLIHEAASALDDPFESPRSSCNTSSPQRVPQSPPLGERCDGRPGTLLLWSESQTNAWDGVSWTSEYETSVRDRQTPYPVHTPAEEEEEEEEEHVVVVEEEHNDIEHPPRFRNLQHHDDRTLLLMLLNNFVTLGDEIRNSSAALHAEYRNHLEAFYADVSNRLDERVNAINTSVETCDDNIRQLISDVHQQNQRLDNYFNRMETWIDQTLFVLNDQLRERRLMVQLLCLLTSQMRQHRP